MVAQTMIFIGKRVEDIVKTGTKGGQWSLNSIRKKVRMRERPQRVRFGKGPKSSPGLKIDCGRCGRDHCNKSMVFRRRI